MSKFNCPNESATSNKISAMVTCLGSSSLSITSNSTLISSSISNFPLISDKTKNPNLKTFNCSSTHLPPSESPSTPRSPTILLTKNPASSKSYSMSSKWYHISLLRTSKKPALMLSLSSLK